MFDRIITVCMRLIWKYTTILDHAFFNILTLNIVLVRNNRYISLCILITRQNRISPKQTEIPKKKPKSQYTIQITFCATFRISFVFSGVSKCWSNNSICIYYTYIERLPFLFYFLPINMLSYPTRTIFIDMLSRDNWWSHLRSFEMWALEVSCILRVHTELLLIKWKSLFRRSCAHRVSMFDIVFSFCVSISEQILSWLWQTVTKSTFKKILLLSKKHERISIEEPERKNIIFSELFYRENKLDRPRMLLKQFNRVSGITKKKMII